MALTRKLLKALGIGEEAIDEIIAAHTDTVDGLKADLARYKKDAEALPGVQKELGDLKAAGDDGYKKKYEDEHRAFEDFKKAQTAKESLSAKETAYRALLKAAGISDKRIDTVIRVTDLTELELKDGKFTDEGKLTESIKTEWADFVTTETETGAPSQTPPAGGTGNGAPKIPTIF